MLCFAATAGFQCHSGRLSEEPTVKLWLPLPKIAYLVLEFNYILKTLFPEVKFTARSLEVFVANKQSLTPSPDTHFNVIKRANYQTCD